MSDTTHLGLPYLAAAQAQKHVTHNEALTRLDALVQLAVIKRSLASPPASPAEGDRYLVAASPTGAWVGQAGKIACLLDGVWQFLTPREGFTLWVDDEDASLTFDGNTWVGAGSPSVLQNLDLLGINATADSANKLAVASTASLFNHAGAGHQVKINKAAAADTASLLFQTGFSGRAEFGTTGDDNFHVKVSSDGTTFHEALVLDAGSGRVTAGKTLRLEPQASDPASPLDGQLWYNSSSNSFRKHQNGVTSDLATTSGGSGLADGDYGDITMSGGGTSLTIDNDVVTYAKMQNVAANSVLARADAASGDVGEVALAASQLFGRGSTGNVAAIGLGKGLLLSGTTLSGGREVLTADRTLYVRTDGNNANDGSANDAAHAFLTVQAAVNAAYKLDLGGYTLTIQLADGTYATAATVNISLDKPFVGGKVVIQGNVTTPANVVLTTTTAAVVNVTAGASVQLKSFKMVSTSGRLVSVYGAGSTVGISGLDFGATTDSHIAVYGQSTLGIEGNYTVSGGAGGAHWGITNGAMITGGGRTVTISAAVTIATWAVGSLLGKLDVSGMTFTNKANVTGTRYWLGTNAVCNTGGGGASYLPGTVAGSSATGGQYQ